MPDIFDKIITREIPAEIIYEDDVVIVFLDINPVNHGHALVVPKKHFKNLIDGDAATLGHMVVTAQKIGKALIAAGLAEGFNLVMNNEPAAEQEVMHAHMHIVPRFMNDGAYKKPDHKECTDAQMSEVGEKLRTTLASTN